jgi:hypothetical protein
MDVTTIDPNEIHIMAPSVERDFLLLSWWNTLIEDGELFDVFAEDTASTPSGFLSLFAAPTTTMFYQRDDAGLTVVMWFEPFMGNAALGMWARKDYRHRHWWSTLLTVLRWVFADVPLVLYITKRQHVVDSSLAVGFTSMGEMPYLYRGVTGYIAYMTREMFEEKYGECKWRV